MKDEERPICLAYLNVLVDGQATRVKLEQLLESAQWETWDEVNGRRWKRIKVDAPFGSFWLVSFELKEEIKGH